MWELDYKESRVSKNWCFWTVVLEKTLESPLDCKEIQPVHPKGDQSWMFIGRTDNWSWNSNTLATWCEELTHWKGPWCWERLRAGGGRDDRGWDGWMASPTRWTWVWVDSESWWWTGKAGVLQSGLKESDKTKQLNWTKQIINISFLRRSWSVQLGGVFLYLFGLGLHLVLMEWDFNMELNSGFLGQPHPLLILERNGPKSRIKKQMRTQTLHTIQ